MLWQEDRVKLGQSFLFITQNLKKQQERFNWNKPYQTIVSKLMIYPLIVKEMTLNTGWTISQAHDCEISCCVPLQRYIS